MPLLKNVEAHWAKIGKPEKKYRSEETQWSINAVCDAKVAKAWQKKGYAQKVRMMDVNGEDMPYILLTKPTHRKSGDENKGVKVFDKYGKDLDPDSIGNGSKVNIQYRTYDWEFQGDKGTKAELVAVQVVELVEYAGGGDNNEFDFADAPQAEEVFESDDDELDLDDFE
tara:strand:+ start:98 stop:604 length:507 start_codon:yes stop_codon:yes gene_type:complete